MRKLRLEFDRLQVESFRTTESKDQRGTVVGQQDTSTYPTYCTNYTCPATFNPAWTPCGVGTNYECTSH